MVVYSFYYQRLFQVSNNVICNTTSKFLYANKKYIWLQCLRYGTVLTGKGDLMLYPFITLTARGELFTMVQLNTGILRTKTKCC